MKSMTLLLIVAVVLLAVTLAVEAKRDCTDGAVTIHDGAWGLNAMGHWCLCNNGLLFPCAVGAGK